MDALLLAVEMNLVLMDAQIVKRFEYFMALVAAVRHPRLVALDVFHERLKVAKRQRTFFFQTFVDLKKLAFVCFKLNGFWRSSHWRSQEQGEIPTVSSSFNN